MFEHTALWQASVQASVPASKHIAYSSNRKAQDFMQLRWQNNQAPIASFQRKYREEQEVSYIHPVWTLTFTSSGQRQWQRLEIQTALFLQNPPEIPQTVTHVFGVGSWKHPTNPTPFQFTWNNSMIQIPAEMKKAKKQPQNLSRTLARPPIRLSILSDVQTLSHTKLGSGPSSLLQDKYSKMISMTILRSLSDPTTYFKLSYKNFRALC